MRKALLRPLLLAVTLAPGMAWGAPAAPIPGPPALTLSQALERALARHPELAAARSEVDAADAAHAQASMRPNPVLETELEDPRRDTRSASLLLSQSIELGGKRVARMEAADRARDVARSRLAARSAQLRAEVAAAFMQTLIAQERLQVAQESVQLAQRGSEAAARRVAAGKVSPIEEIRARVAEANVRLEMSQAQGELRSGLLALSTITGSSPFIERIEGATTLPSAPEHAALQAQLAQAPVLQQARLEVERLGALARLERARRVPDMNVGLGVKHSQELGRHQPLLVLSMPLPVFDAGSHSEREALRPEDSARHELEVATLRLHIELGQAHERLIAAVVEAEAVQREVRPGAQMVYDAAVKGFELGKFGFLDVLDAQRTLLEARIRQLRATAEAHRASAEIDRLLGTDATSLRGQ